MSTRGAQRCVRTTPTGLPDWISRVSSSRELAQLGDDRVERLPGPCRPAGPAVDDQVVGILGHLGVEVVHEHPESRFLLPAAARHRGPAGRPNGTRPGRRHVELPPHHRKARVGDGHREPDRFPERGCRCARGVRVGADLGEGLDDGEPAVREIVTYRTDQGLCQPGATRGRGRRDTRDDGRRRRNGERGIELASPHGSRIRGQRTELRVRGRRVVEEEDLGVAPGDTQTTTEQLEFPRRVRSDRRTGLGRRGERVRDRPFVLVAGGEERVGRAGRCEGIGLWRGRLEIGEERIGRLRPRWRRRRRRGASLPASQLDLAALDPWSASSQ